MLKFTPLSFRRNCHPALAWYVRVYNALPDFMRPWYCESARVGFDCRTFCRFGWKVAQRPTFPDHGPLYDAVDVFALVSIVLSTLAIIAAFVTLPTM